MYHPANPRLVEWLRNGAAVARGGGAKGGGKSTTTSQVQYSPEEEARRKQVFEAGEALYKAQAPSSGEYRGPAPVGFDPATIAAQNLTYGSAIQGADVNSNAARAANFALTDAKDVNSNPYLQEAIKAAMRPQIQAFTEQTLPAMRMGAMVGGASGSSRPALNQGIAAGKLSDSLASTAAGMANAGYTSGLQASTDTMRALPGLMQSFSAPAAMMSQVGAQRENLAQETENYNAAQRVQAVNGPWELLNSWSGVLQNMSNPITQTTASMPRQGISPIQGIGGLASLVSMAGKLCWVARLVFGPESPKWILFRVHLEVVGPRWLRRLYERHGEAFAEWLRKRSWAQRLVRAWMQRCIAQYEEPADA